MDKALFETLLQKTEGEDLDFKSKQYKMDTEEQKAKFIKDILAFTNSWKISNAYIICGVFEEDGRAKKLLGVDHHLQDNNLQQLVCSKTNRPPKFRYESFTYNGMKFGIIVINKRQPRPIFLTRDYGKLKAGVVYIRRGSSTGIASTEEIEKMVSARYSFNELDIRLKNRKNNKILDEDIITLKSTYLHFYSPHEKSQNEKKQEAKNIDFKIKEIGKVNKEIKTAFDGFNTLNQRISRIFQNPDYIKELKEYKQNEALFIPISFIVENTGSSTANDVKTEIRIKKADDLNVHLSYSEFEPPSKYKASPFDRLNLVYDKKSVHDIISKETEDEYVFVIKFGKIQPKDRVESNGFLYIGAFTTLEFSMSTKTFADDLPEPIKKPFNFKIEVSEENYNLEEFT